MIFQTNTDLPEDLGELDLRHTLRPWTNFGQTQAPMVITHGQGARLWDDTGRSYLDAIGGMWCTQIGQGRPEMAEAIAAQVRKLSYTSTFVDTTSDPTALLSAKLVELSPSGLSHVYHTTGGSEAIDSAYRLIGFVQASLGRPEKTHVIAREHSYHGATYAAASIGKRKGDRPKEFRFKTDTIHHVSAPYLYRRPAGLTEDQFTDVLVDEFIARIEEIGPERVGGFFAEPVQASGGVLVPPPDYLRRMKAVCERYDILFVADEVVTGFGRLGEWFASETLFGVTPDILTTAKGLTSGYQPLGAMLFSEAIWEAMATDPNRWFTCGFTYSGHPVACAAALKNIEIIETEDLLGRARRLGPVLQERLKALRDLPLVGDTRGLGLMACIENVADKATKALLPDDLDIGSRIAHRAETKGLFVRPMGHLNVMSPALVITEEEIEFIGTTLEATIREVADELTREGVRLG